MEAVIIIGLDTRILRINPAAERMFGYFGTETMWAHHTLSRTDRDHHTCNIIHVKFNLLYIRHTRKKKTRNTTFEKSTNYLSKRLFFSTCTSLPTKRLFTLVRPHKWPGKNSNIKLCLLYGMSPTHRDAKIRTKVKKREYNSDVRGYIRSSCVYSSNVPNKKYCCDTFVVIVVLTIIVPYLVSKFIMSCGA